MTTTYVSIDWGGTNLKGIILSPDFVSDMFIITSQNLRVITDENLLSVCDNLIKTVRTYTNNPVKWLIGAAGAGNKTIYDRLANALNQVAQTPQEVEVYPDYVCNHAAALGGADGILSINGTGSILYGVKDNTTLRLGGWGFLFDETPSGSYFGKKYIEAVLSGLDGDSSLQGYIDNFENSDGNSIDSGKLLNQIYSSTSIQTDIGKFARKLTAAYDANAPYAIDSINTSINKLCLSIQTMIKRLNLEQPNFCGTGGIWDNWKPFKELVDNSCKNLGIELNWCEKSQPLWMGPIYHYARFNIDAQEILPQIKQRHISSNTTNNLVERQALTETRNPRTRYIDRASTKDAVKYFIQEDANINKAIEASQENIAKAADFAYSSFSKGGRLIYIGAGTSGRLGVLDASECPPTFGVPPSMVVGIIAGGDKALRDAIEGAEDEKEGGVRDLKAVNFTADDTLVGIAASGTTPYVVGGLEYAKSIGAKTVLLCCNPYGKLFNADTIINVAVGPEVIAGSTRLKSGTACKMVLNMISSISMIKIGKVYENLMVDVKATNNKLKRRAVKIVMEAGHISTNDEAERILKQAGGNLKYAIVMTRLNISLEEAKAKLEKAGGYLYKALDEPEEPTKIYQKEQK